MAESFELPVTYKGEQLIIPGILHLYGFTQKIEVNVNGLSVMYERDEERNWRAIVDPLQLEKNQSVQTELLQAIADSIEEVLKQ